MRCFIGIPAQSALTPETATGLTLLSYCGTGSNSALYEAGLLDIMPVHYSALPGLLSGGSIRADVVFVQVSAADEHGHHALGLADDYFSAALDTARVVIAEVNDQVPFTFGARTLTSNDWTHAIHTSRVPAELAKGKVTPVIKAVAENVATLIGDGSTLQFGIGTLPEACLAELTDLHDLGIHSGIVNDTSMDLIEAGVANGSRKSVDRGVAIACLLGGSARMFRLADRNPRLELRSTRYTHDPLVLAAQHQLIAINSAIEVDLTGQVNAETAGKRYVGAVGGAMDFLRGAAASKGGVPIVALPSASHGGTRIVSTLSGPVSTPRADGFVVVTEHGIADLRGLSLAERVGRMIAIADPEYRAALEADAERVLATTSLESQGVNS